MNIEKMLASLTPEKLEEGLSKLNGILSEEQLKNAKSVLQNTDKTELSKKLSNANFEKIKKDPRFKDLFK